MTAFASAVDCVSLPKKRFARHVAMKLSSLLRGREKAGAALAACPSAAMVFHVLQHQWHPSGTYRPVDEPEQWPLAQLWDTLLNTVLQRVRRLLPCAASALDSACGSCHACRPRHAWQGPSREHAVVLVQRLVRGAAARKEMEYLRAMHVALQLQLRFER